MSRALDFFSLFIGREFEGVCGRLDTRCNDFEATKVIIVYEAAKLQSHLVSRAARFHKPVKCTRYLRKIRSGIVALCDQLLACTGDPEAMHAAARKEQADSLRSLARICSDTLQDLLQYMTVHFPASDSPEQKVTESARLGFLRTSAVTVKIIRQTLAPFADSPLLSIALHPIEVLLEDTQGLPMTNDSLYYFGKLLRKMQAIPGNDRTNEGVYEVLFYLNFNGIHFRHYWVLQVEADLELLPTDTERTERLIWHQKQNNRCLVKADIGHYPGLPSLKKEIGDWITGELHIVALRMAAAKIAIPQNQDAEAVKINTTFSVNVLAGLSSILVKSGIITNKNHLDVLRVLAGSFTTLRCQEISIESLRSKFYGVDRRTAETLRDLFLKLAEVARKLGMG